ncbi:hypothetical protein [Rhodanobacter sp. PCA2]|uniref:hypothetical protein n=1 Tax=Rhodanobacter sp. PCA2 TaxID=2006117 RepID=UPI00210651B4|nr:hypothetical protein [Rhodanobacter sp. PCA2]
MSALSFDTVHALLQRWRADPGGTYQSWFLWERRLKHFRSIRRGLQAVVEEIDTGTFGTAYRGLSLETVVHSIAEQRQIFKGADHAFMWKPKLRMSGHLRKFSASTGVRTILADVSVLRWRTGAGGGGPHAGWACHRGLGAGGSQSPLFHAPHSRHAVQYSHPQRLQRADGGESSSRSLG